MKIKICGITNSDDAVFASNAGADALGFVFYPLSPRYIEPQRVKEIIENLPPFVQSVGLFVNNTVDEINQIAKLTGIDLVQIHFGCDDIELEKLEVKYIKVVRVSIKEDIKRFENEYRIVDAFVDSFGGEGKRINLEWFKDVDCSKIIIAGGLDESNLEQLNGFGFYGVDVSSGVESFKGIKDHKRIYGFIKKANEIN